MIIKNISIVPIKHVMVNPLKTHLIHHKIRDSWIIKITDSDGISGYGESSPLPYFNYETFEASGYALEGFRLAVQDLIDDIALEEILILIDAHTMDVPSASFAIQTAFYDILSQKNNLSLSKYLNLESLSKIRVNGVDGLTQLGNYRVIKVKCGFRNLYNEIKFLELISEKYEKGTSFIIDLNQAYDLPKAIRFLKEISQFNIAYIEQPLDKNNIEDLVELRFHSNIPLALDESINNIDSINSILDYNAADIFIIKPQSMGSFIKINEAVKLIRSADKKVTLSSSLEGSIGRYSTMHLAAANRIDMCCGLALEQIYKHEKHKFPQLNSGVIKIPSSFGVGYRAD